MTRAAAPNLGEVFRPVAPAVREAELELERARQAFLAARTPFARRKALRRLERAKARVEACGAG
jgi:hypothetical protein